MLDSFWRIVARVMQENTKGYNNTFFVKSFIVAVVRELSKEVAALLGSWMVLRPKIFVIGC